MAAKQHTAPNPPVATTCITLSALAAALGELEPPPGSGECDLVHLHRQEALFAVAGMLPVRSPQDAAYALSAIADHLGEVIASDMDEFNRNLLLKQARRALARVAYWVRAQHGGMPLAAMWTEDAHPFDGSLKDLA